jgi:uncharacterized protein (TIGR00255 family)
MLFSFLFLKLWLNKENYMNGMTGYSYKEFYDDDTYISTEIKTVNSRFLDININVPNYLNFMELGIKDLIKKKLSRGKIDVYVNLKITENLYDISANLELTKQYHKNLKAIIDELNLKDEVRLFHLTKYDDVIHVERKRDYSKYWQKVEESLNNNLKEIQQMRSNEGQSILKDLTLIFKNIQSHLEDIAKRVPDMEKEIFENVKDKVFELLNDKVDEVKLLNETAFLVSKSCINEEIVILERGWILFARKCTGKLIPLEARLR